MIVTYIILAPSTLSYWLALTLSVLTAGLTSCIVIFQIVREQATDYLNNAREQAEAGTRAKSAFLANMSHEIRTPMNGVIGMLTVLNDTNLDARQKEYVEIARDSARDLLTTLNDILDISKLESGRMAFEKIPFDIRETLHTVAALMSPKAQEKNLTLTEQVDDTVPDFLLGDPSRIRQILANLTGNAVKFTQEGSIAIKASYHANKDGSHFVKIAVNDTGIGMAKDVQAHLFERFFQADSSSTRRFGGTGLGLAICRLLTEQMGGTIGVESAPQRGSTFWFTIPTEPAEGIIRKDCTGHMEQPHRRAINLLNILSVEDNTVNQQVISYLLESYGHHVTSAGSGQEALSALSNQAFDIILMDIQMNGMDGIATTHAIRAMEGDAGKIPIIALTANVMPGDREKCLAAGMDGYVGKPFDVEDLNATLAKLTQGKA